MTITQLIADIYRKTKTNASSFPTATVLIPINKAMSRATSLIIGADGRWQYDDTNQTDLPIATTALVSGQQDYAITTGHLRITRVEIKNTSGRWSVLRPRDQDDDTFTALSEVSTVTGMPTQYDVLGNSIFLTQPPNYSQAASLKLYFQRGPSEFTSAEVSTGTKTPGFNSLYHGLISAWVAYEYATENGKANANLFLAEVQRLESAMVADYAKRNKDERPIMTMKGINYI